MWDMSFMMPCAFLLFTILGFYFSKERLPVRANATFLMLLITQLAVMGTDVLSTLADQNYQQHSVAALYLANIAYFVAFLLRCYLFFRFALHVAHVGDKATPRAERLLSLPFWVSVLICASSFFTGAFFSIGSDGYHKGPLYNVLYVCSFFYIFTSMALVIARRRGLRHYELGNALGYNVVLALGSAIRYLFPKILVMDTFCTVAITIIFLGFMNPDLFIDDRELAFNNRGLRMMLSEEVERGDCHVLGIAIKNYHQERGIMGDQQMDDVLESITSWIHQSFPRHAPFYLGVGRFVLTGDSSVDWKSVHAQVSARFNEPWETESGALRLGAVFVYINEASALVLPSKITSTLSLTLEAAQQDARLGTDTEGDMLSIQEVDEQMRIMRALEQAITNNEVEVFLQPLILGSTRCLVGAEALARIRDEEGNIISPALFIPMAERTGLIHELGEQVLDKTCAFIASHDTDALGLQWVNVNLSPTQCINQNLVERFASIIERHGVPASMIHLEITEESMVDYSLIIDRVNSLRAMGFQFVLDDYGAGYSNLTRLREFPFVNIKLDMAVVRSYCTELDSLLPIVVNGFKDVGYSITAEGIETEEMAALLTGIGTDYLQGFLFSKPVPTEEFVQVFAAA